MAFSRPAVSAAQGRVIEKEWVEGLSKQKPKTQQKVKTSFGVYVQSLNRDLKNFYNLSKSPKQFIETGDNLIRVAQQIFTVLKKINKQYIRRKGNEKNPSYILFKSMLKYWQRIAEGGRLPFWNKYNDKTMSYNLLYLSKLERDLRKTFD